MSHSEVFIIGAGPAGLTASYLLTKEGVATTVIEADPVYVGGISRTANYKGFLFDIGGHGIGRERVSTGGLERVFVLDDAIADPDGCQQAEDQNADAKRRPVHR